MIDRATAGDGSSAGLNRASGSPLLSIGIPTHNRSRLLKIALEALLPQTEDRISEVEVLVSDNASTDDTPSVVDGFLETFRFRSIRNPDNLGPVRNMNALATELAAGEYVWLLGDDDLVAPGAIERVLDVLRKNRDLEVFYANFRCARFDEHWPESAAGGYDGPYDRLANSDSADRPVKHWRELVRAESWMATQVYAHIVRRQVWIDYWRDRGVGETHSHARWTWPHTCMIAESLAESPTYYIGQPVLTIFDQSQSWLDERAQINMFRTPELMRLCRRAGVAKTEIRSYSNYMLRSARADLRRALEVEPSAHTAVQFVRANWRSAFAWRVALGALAEARPRSVLGRVVGWYRRKRYGGLPDQWQQPEALPPEDRGSSR
jgi:glycosyltransferase involved in cell wall biosynthesis